jgi:hypothetical protein
VSSRDWQDLYDNVGFILIYGSYVLYRRRDAMAVLVFSYP